MNKKLEPHIRGWLHLLSTGVDEGTRQVERVHRRIADMPFDLLAKTPVAPVSETIHVVEKKITSTVYESIRHFAKVGIQIAQNKLPTHGMIPPESDTQQDEQGATARAPHNRNK